MKNIFFAPSKDEAEKYARQCNEKEGYKIFDVPNLHPARDQTRGHGWITWVDVEEDSSTF